MPYLQQNKRYYLSDCIKLSTSQMRQLSLYQQIILKKLHLVELDHTRLQNLIEPFLYSGKLNPSTCVQELKPVIVSYYFLRSRFPTKISDDDLLETLFEVFMQETTFDKTLMEKTKENLVERMKSL